MQVIYCPNCQAHTGFKRSLGFGTFFAVVITAGLWLLAIPFYPVRCIKCGLTREDAGSGIKYLVVVAALAVLVLMFAIPHGESPTSDSERVQSPAPVVVVPQPSTTIATETKVESRRSVPPAYAIGQTFSVGYWSYACNRAFWTPWLGFDVYSTEHADADFVVVDISVRNDDTSASTVPPFQLVDTEGKTYDETSKGTVGGNFFFPLERLNPDVSKRANVAFDVPPNRQYFLLVSGGIESGKHALVALPMPNSPQQSQTQ